ncbi:MAG: hypothetical protein CR968_03285 [Flavobacteriia bacterium]|nr:MAG: hypothetical protein CR968_03285 [Flavobacteriia bacterium]
MNLKYTLLLVCVVFTFNTFAQLSISAELRPRSEFRNGYKTLISEGEDAAFFISQRTKLNTKYATDKYTFFVSIQDVRTWGDVRQLNVSDNNGLGLHEAWGKVNLGDFAIKAGRQEIKYDDQRMFGSANWAQQARSHDALLFKMRKNKFKMDVGLAYNQEGQRLFGTVYELNNYKTFQYVWLHNQWSDFSASLLILNNGIQYVDPLFNGDDKVRFSQTIGTHLKVNFIPELKASANLYYQTGKDAANRDLSAFLAGVDLGYKVGNNTNVGLGFEMQSGNDYQTDLAVENKAFTPFYGTNHKYNGIMDYFYVGNHMNNVGLMNVYAKVNTKLYDKASLTAFVHNFMSQGQISSDTDKQLGTEVDLVYKYKLSKDVSFGLGYSHMFAGDAMEVLKSKTDNGMNNWAWVMLTFKPTLFTKE